MIIGHGLRYLFQIIVARSLGTQLYGLFILGLAVFNVIEMLAECGLASGVVRFVALYRGEGDDRRVKGTILLALKWTALSASLMTLVLAALAHPLAVHFFHKPELGGVLRMFSLGILLAALTNILVSATQGSKIMTYSVVVNEVFEPVVRVALVGTAFLLMGSHLLGVLGAYLAPVWLGAVLAYYYLGKTFPVIKQKAVLPIYEKKRFLDFSLPMLFVQFFGLWSISIDTLMLGYFKTSQEVGIYSAAQKTALVGNIIFVSFSSIFAPIAADLYNRKELPLLSLYYKTVTKWMLALSLPL
jgi:O-antigen/teichoic acid export membrane protein